MAPKKNKEPPPPPSEHNSENEGDEGDEKNGSIIADAITPEASSVALTIFAKKERPPRICPHPDCPNPEIRDTEMTVSVFTRCDRCPSHEVWAHRSCTKGDPSKMEPYELWAPLKCNHEDCEGVLKYRARLPKTPKEQKPKLAVGVESLDDWLSTFGRPESKHFLSLGSHFSPTKRIGSNDVSIHAGVLCRPVYTSDIDRKFQPSKPYTK
eukprot:Rmarinus@m.4561